MSAATMSRARAQEIDKHVGLRIRQRRVMLGLTQKQMAEQIGVTFQQAYKYENGTNRITAGRLARIADVLGVEVGYFFQGVDAGEPSQPDPQERMMLYLARHFISLPRRDHQEAVCMVAQAMIDAEPAAQQG